MSHEKTSTCPKRTLANSRYAILREHGATTKEAEIGSTHALRFAEALVAVGGSPEDYPAENMLSYGGKRRVENADAPACRRRYAKLRAMGVDPYEACRACKTGVMFHQLRAEVEASSRSAAE
jgi:hypothetical protein